MKQGIKSFYTAKKNVLLMFTDAVIVCSAWFIALVLRFEGNFTSVSGRMYADMMKQQIVYLVAVHMIVFFLFRVYRIAWKYAGVSECVYLGSAAVIGVFVNYVVGTMTDRLPRSVYIITLLMILIFTVGFRLSGRIMGMRMPMIGKAVNQIKVMIVGAGSGGVILIKEMQASGNRRVPVIAVDDDPHKYRQRIHGVIVAGNRRDIPQLAKEYMIDEILIALPSVDDENYREILKICTETGVKMKTMPSIKDMIEQEVSMSQLRDVSIEDLLGRDPVDLDVASVSDYIKDEIVLVTGGGGSIGSEICRQIARLKPNLLVIFDIYENNAYDIEIELKQKYGRHLNLEVRIGSVRDKQRLDEIFRQFRPTIVFHAAAHKHVPLMENSPLEAIKNNVFGTYNVAQCADRYETKSFVLISTDKAVNPTNIMGASKRITELIVQHMSHISETKFVAVRFGNVLGSNGSVIPLFKKQIEAGGPVTVTHPEMTRFFMTIPEASKLVIQAGATALGGEIFILDMGQSVKIDDLAKNLIRLSGLQPGVDIEIKYTGLRPGEKMYEELLLEEEGIKATKYKKIFVAKPIELSQTFWDKIQKLEEAMNHSPVDLSEAIEDIIEIKLTVNL